MARTRSSKAPKQSRVARNEVRTNMVNNEVGNEPSVSEVPPPAPSRDTVTYSKRDLEDDGESTETEDVDIAEPARSVRTNIALKPKSDTRQKRTAKAAKVREAPKSSAAGGKKGTAVAKDTGRFPVRETDSVLDYSRFHAALKQQRSKLYPKDLSVSGKYMVQKYDEKDSDFLLETIQFAKNEMLRRSFDYYIFKFRKTVLAKKEFISNRSALHIKIDNFLKESYELAHEFATHNDDRERAKLEMMLIANIRRFTFVIFDFRKLSSPAKDRWKIFRNGMKSFSINVGICLDVIQSLWSAFAELKKRTRDLRNEKYGRENPDILAKRITNAKLNRETIYEYKTFDKNLCIQLFRVATRKITRGYTGESHQISDQNRDEIARGFEKYLSNNLKLEEKKDPYFKAAMNIRQHMNKIQKYIQERKSSTDVKQLLNHDSKIGQYIACYIHGGLVEKVHAFLGDLPQTTTYLDELME